MIQIPGYLIKREIGSGGMATVYLAVQMSLEREVALKVMNPALVSDPNFSRRFLTEARTLASLSHPNNVAVYDDGVSESQLHYFSMQHLPGGDFAKRIKLGATQAEVLRVLAGVARALGFAHARGFVHRDVSPANVLFDASDGPILTDFGIARAVTRTSRLTNAGVSVGTSHYMSPEQARGGNVDARSDIYSLGAVAYEALTGKPPYDGEDGFAIAYAHVFEPIPRLPPPLAHWQPLIDQALAKHPNERFVDLDGFLNALDAVAGAVGMPPVTGQQRAVPQNATMVFSAADVPGAVPVTQQFAQMPPMEPATREMPMPTAPVAAPAPAPAYVAAPVAAPEPYVPAATSAKPPRRMALAAAAIVVLGIAGLAIALLLGDRGGDRGGAVAGTTPSTSPAATPSATPGATPLDPSTALVAVDASPTPVATTTPVPVPVESPAYDPLAAPAPDEQGYDALADDTTGIPEGAVPEATPDEAAMLKRAIDTTAVDPLATALALARSDLAAKRLSQPPGRNALDRNRIALKLAEKFRAPAEATKAKQGIVDTAAAYLDLAEETLAQKKEPEFLDYLAKGEEVAASLPEGAPVVARAKARRAQLRDAQIKLAREATARWDKAGAVAAWQKALVFDPQSADAKKGVQSAQRIGEPGFAFRDAAKGGAQAPEMVVVQAGGKKIAAARTETTLADFRRFAGASSLGARPGCRDRESIFRRAKGYESADIAQDASHPVVCVSWDDADRYAKWLSQVTGKRYRLPTEAEWTALARGSDSLAPCRANVADRSYATAYKERDAYDCDDGFAGTAPVRRFDATAAGVYDIAGNAREWVGDCASCGKHTAMGSSWFSRPKDKAEPQREAFNADVASNTVGFRVVRDVD
ncbi:MAG TPA: SUMF1/EgtB/PvdO family nonheme iron enzyme [Xanthomonadales bacterium]|nr:SUMF1/EgtB/PvdO family nonheme iron enzyme [Xanthomonadales bacterium]